MLYFDPRLFQEKKEVSEKEYNPKKISEYLGYGKFDFFYLDFPFSESKINSIYCGKSKKDYIFKNNKIIFPISKNGPGKFTCKLNTTLDGKNKSFDILDVYFRKVTRATTKVTLTKKYATGPSTELQKIIAAERLMLREIYKKSNSSIKFNSAFEAPLNTKMISEFGKTRIFNNGRKSVHSGTDYRAQTPLPVKAINDGEVILANIDLYYCGKGVIINHGMNIFSTYCHLSENKVFTGDKVKKGDVIGLTGSTGRVSGPHLHLSVKYNGGYVDFEELQKKSEISFK
ncbi:MAG TPA: M23 family metallopeptidase [Candidatus Pacebacteria bacterium]|nr:M23 family metallopeptidase [Candidatus Paceibacterota bacterium]HIP34253.1 M23 family metallopeptidase [Bacteroidia bacterium]